MSHARTPGQHIANHVCRQHVQCQWGSPNTRAKMCAVTARRPVEADVMHRGTNRHLRHTYPRLRTIRIAGFSDPLTVRRPHDPELRVGSASSTSRPCPVAGGPPHCFANHSSPSGQGQTAKILATGHAPVEAGTFPACLPSLYTL